MKPHWIIAVYVLYALLESVSEMLQYGGYKFFLWFLKPELF
jgi:hypothetical protein